MSSIIEINKNHEPEIRLGNDDHELIVDPLRIGNLFNKLLENKSSLEVSIAGNIGKYYTSLLDVDIKQQSLIIDEVLPTEGNKKFVSFKKVNIHSKVEGITLNFHSVIRNSLLVDGYTCYEILFPNILHFKQRRRFFRAFVGLYKKVPVFFSIKNYKNVICKLRNISSGGMMVECSDYLPDWISVGTNLPDWTLQISPDTTIPIDAKICFLKKYNDRSGYVIGVKFNKLSSTHQHFIDQFVAELNRDFVKKVLTNRITDKVKIRK